VSGPLPLPAFPIPLNPGEPYREHAACDGLTKRELIAAMAMQGLLASGRSSSPEVANDAVVNADALLDILTVAPTSEPPYKHLLSGDLETFDSQRLQIAQRTRCAICACMSGDKS